RPDQVAGHAGGGRRDADQPKPDAAGRGDDDVVPAVDVRQMLQRQAPAAADDRVVEQLERALFGEAGFPVAPEGRVVLGAPRPETVRVAEQRVPFAQVREPYDVVVAAGRGADHGVAPYRDRVVEIGLDAVRMPVVVGVQDLDPIVLDDDIRVSVGPDAVRLARREPGRGDEVAPDGAALEVAQVQAAGVLAPDIRSDARVDGAVPDRDVGRVPPGDAGPPEPLHRDLLQDDVIVAVGVD